MKELSLKRGQLQPLWVGVAVPATARGAYTGAAQVRVGGDKVIPVRISLRVEGSPLVDAGDSVARKLSRLRWPDSTVGSGPSLTRPYIAVQTQDRVIKILGRELELGPDGLPARIASHFSPANTRIEETSREVLARPMAFVVETATGPVSWQSRCDQLQHTDLEATWTATSAADGLRAELLGRSGLHRLGRSPRPPDSRAGFGTERRATRSAVPGGRCALLHGSEPSGWPTSRSRSMELGHQEAPGLLLARRRERGPDAPIQRRRVSPSARQYLLLLPPAAPTQILGQRGSRRH